MFIKYAYGIVGIQATTEQAKIEQARLQRPCFQYYSQCFLVRGQNVQNTVLAFSSRFFQTCAGAEWCHCSERSTRWQSTPFAPIVQGFSREWAQ